MQKIKEAEAGRKVCKLVMVTKTLDWRDISIRRTRSRYKIVKYLWEDLYLLFQKEALEASKNCRKKEKNISCQNFYFCLLGKNL